MGVDRAVDPAGEARRTASHDRYARRGGGDPVYSLWRSPVADAAALLSAGLDGARLFLRVAGQRPSFGHQPVTREERRSH